MFDIGIGFSELMLLAVIVIIVVGPEELPSLLRTIGRYVKQVKRIADDFRSQVDDAIKEPMEEIQQSIDGVSENLDDDPFGEEDMIDFDDHNQKVLDQEEGERLNETAVEKALRESGMDGLETAKKTDELPEPDSKSETPAKTADDDVVLAQKSGT